MSPTRSSESLKKLKHGNTIRCVIAKVLKIKCISSITIPIAQGERFDFYPKQSLNVSSYRLLSVKRELEDLVLQMQQPSLLR